jgi:hypothetical protein
MVTHEISLENSITFTLVAQGLFYLERRLQHSTHYAIQRLIGGLMYVFNGVNKTENPHVILP